MSYRFQIHFRIINIWLGVVFALVLLSNVPHRPVPLESWLNYALYLFLFLQCLFIAIKEQHNKAIFINLAIVCLIYGLSLLNTYIGEGYLFGDNYLDWYVTQYRKIALSFFLAVAVVYLCVRYVCHEYSTWLSYVITIALILPFFLWHFYPYLADPNYLYNFDVTEGLKPLYKSMLVFTFLPLFFIILYGILLYRNEHSMGEHVNTLAVCFLIMLINCIVDYTGSVYNIKLFALGQQIFSITLAIFVLTLFAKLHYIYSDFGLFYDNLLVGRRELGVNIKRRESGLIMTLSKLGSTYLHERKHVFGILTLSMVVVINFLRLSTFLKIYITAFMAIALLLVSYLLALHTKRSKSDHMLTVKPTTHQDT